MRAQTLLVGAATTLHCVRPTLQLDNEDLRRFVLHVRPVKQKHEQPPIFVLSRNMHGQLCAVLNRPAYSKVRPRRGVNTPY